MSYKVIIRYLDEYGNPENHEIDDTSDNKKYLMYTDLSLPPCMISDIMKHGLIIDRKNGPDGWTRDGSLIPPHRILRIWWSDTLIEDEFNQERGAIQWRDETGT